MAPTPSSAAKRSRKRIRNPRTQAHDISSSSSSESDESREMPKKPVVTKSKPAATTQSTTSTSTPAEKHPKKYSKSKPVSAASPRKSPFPTPSSPLIELPPLPQPSPGPSTTSPTPPNEKSRFETTYLRLLTAQYDNDLDKIREAADFKDSSLDVLVHALKQGVLCFGPDEIGSGNGGSVV